MKTITIILQSRWGYKVHLALGKSLAADVIKVFFLGQPQIPGLVDLGFLRSRPPATQALFPKESSDFAAWLRKVVAKKAFECIGQINLSV